ncbi:MAG: Crp/Fnr family transcriptional regulator [Thermoanaerobaculia bacterium]
MRSPRSGPTRFEDCATYTWRSEGLFRDITPEALDALNAISLTSIFPGGTVLYSMGDPSGGVFVLCRGAVKLSVSSAAAKTIILRIVGPGEVLGLSSLISGNAHKSTAETLEPSQMSYVRRDDFTRFMDTYREVWANAARTLAQECETNADHVRALELTRTAAEKMAYLILSWCEVDGMPRGSACRVRMLMTHEHVAQLIGTTRETVTRILAEFRRKNLITLRGSTLIVPNRAALESLVHV